MMQIFRVSFVSVGFGLMPNSFDDVGAYGSPHAKVSISPDGELHHEPPTHDTQFHTTLSEDGNSLSIHLQHGGSSIRRTLQPYSLFKDGKDTISEIASKTTTKQLNLKHFKSGDVRVHLQKDGVAAWFQKDEGMYHLKKRHSDEKVSAVLLQNQPGVTHYSKDEVDRLDIDEDFKRQLHASLRNSSWVGSTGESGEKATPWFPGCFDGDDNLHGMAIGLVVDLAFQKRAAQHNVDYLEWLFEIFTHTQYLYENQLNIKPEIGWLKVYTSDKKGVVPNFARCVGRRLDTMRGERAVFGSGPGSEYDSVAAIAIVSGCMKGITGNGQAIGEICGELNKGTYTEITAEWHHIDMPFFRVFAHELMHLFGPPHHKGIMMGGAGDYEANAFSMYTRSKACGRTNQYLKHCSEAAFYPLEGLSTTPPPALQPLDVGYKGCDADTAFRRRTFRYSCDDFRDRTDICDGVSCCSVAAASRRRGYGAEAQQHCKRSCGLEPTFAVGCETASQPMIRSPIGEDCPLHTAPVLDWPCPGLYSSSKVDGMVTTTVVQKMENVSDDSLPSGCVEVEWPKGTKDSSLEFSRRTSMISGKVTITRWHKIKMLWNDAPGSNIRAAINGSRLCQNRLVLSGPIASKSCPAGSASLLVKERCEQIAAELGVGFASESVSKEDAPSGCFLDAQGLEMGFNTHPTGGSAPYLAPVCFQSHTGDEVTESATTTKIDSPTTAATTATTAATTQTTEPATTASTAATTQTTEPASTAATTQTTKPATVATTRTTELATTASTSSQTESTSTAGTTSTATTTLSTEDQFVVTAKGTNKCPNGYKIIESSELCKIAKQSLPKTTFRSIKSWDYIQGGCILGKRGMVNFNKDMAGQVSPHYSSICTLTSAGLPDTDY